KGQSLETGGRVADGNTHIAGSDQSIGVDAKNAVNVGLIFEVFHGALDDRLARDRMPFEDCDDIAAPVHPLEKTLSVEGTILRMRHETKDDLFLWRDPHRFSSLLDF